MTNLNLTSNLKMNHSICWLRRRFNWMGEHSGYDLLCNAIATLPSNNGYHSIWHSPEKPLPRGTSRLISRVSKGVKSSPTYNLSSTYAEVKLFLEAWRKQPELIHITYVENQLGMIADWRQYLRSKIIGTAHQPPSWWRLQHKFPSSISALDALIVPARSQLYYFEQYLPGRVFFIPHGIDINFFCPKVELNQSFKKPRCIFVGIHLRDIATLSKIVDQVLLAKPHVQFDLVIPSKNRNYQEPSQIKLAQYDQVHWHTNLSDEQLRNLYQNATLLVLPLFDCTANNAVLEAIACGLPIISNNVGGMPDYTDSSFASLFPIEDIQGMTNAIIDLLENPEKCIEKANKAREYATNHFSWSKVAAKTYEIYEKVISSSI